MLVDSSTCRCRSSVHPKQCSWCVELGPKQRAVLGGENKRIGNHAKLVLEWPQVLNSSDYSARLSSGPTRLGLAPMHVR